MLSSRSFPVACRTLAALAAVVLCSCQSAIPPAKINELYRDVIYQRDTQYRIKPGDTIEVSFFGDSKFDQALLVLPDGRTDPYFMNNAIVAQKTVPELEAEIRRFYEGQIRNPEIRIHVQPKGEIIYLHGAVRRPGVQDYVINMTLSQVLSRAGGYEDTASIDDIVLKRSYRYRRTPDRFVVDFYDTSEEVLLLPDDEIIVYRTWWIVIRDYLREYIWGILPVDPRTLFGVSAF